MIAFFSCKAYTVAQYPVAIFGNGIVETIVDTVAYRYTVEKVCTFVVIILVETFACIVGRDTTSENMRTERSLLIIAATHFESVAITFVITVVQGPAVVFYDGIYRVVEVPSVVAVVP